jgi:hypothetical protein
VRGEWQGRRKKEMIEKNKRNQIDVDKRKQQKK